MKNTINENRKKVTMKASNYRKLCEILGLLSGVLFAYYSYQAGRASGMEEASNTIFDVLEEANNKLKEETNNG